MNNLEVRVGFYRYDHDMYFTNDVFLKNSIGLEYLWVKMIRKFTRCDYTHCTIELGENSLVYLVGKDATFASTETVERFLGTPDLFIELGRLDVNVTGVDRLISRLYQGTILKVLIWFFITRWFGFRKPKTCATLVCEILGLCGYRIKRCVSPAELLKEINKCNL